MHADEWNKSDTFELELYSPAYPLEGGVEGLDEVLDVMESLDNELRPDKLSILKRRMKYSRQALRKHIDKGRVGEATSFFLFRSRPPDASWQLSCFGGNEDARFCLRLYLEPFAWCREPGHEEQRAGHMLDVVRAIAARLPLSYGYAHSFTDYHIGPEPALIRERFVPEQVIGAYWLNVYGPRLVQTLGLDRLMSTPSPHVEALPHGAVLMLTRPTPADFDSETARLAQARALVHLRPELKPQEVLASLRQRSLHFVPVPIQFHPDVAEILLEEATFHGLYRQREQVERFNQYRPPPVSDWLPAHPQLPPDVGDASQVRRYIDAFEGDFIDSLRRTLRKSVPQLAHLAPESLPHLDWYVWHMGWGKHCESVTRDIVWQGMGALLGLLLVRELGGRWVPRRDLDTAAVVVGDRAWLPFLRARHAFEGRDAPLDHSLTHLFREARRLHG